jgi:hypothetical protein
MSKNATPEPHFSHEDWGFIFWENRYLPLFKGGQGDFRAVLKSMFRFESYCDVITRSLTLDQLSVEC